MTRLQSDRTPCTAGGAGVEVGAGLKGAGVTPGGESGGRVPGKARRWVGWVDGLGWVSVLAGLSAIMGCTWGDGWRGEDHGLSHLLGQAVPPGDSGTVLGWGLLALAAAACGLAMIRCRRERAAIRGRFAALSDLLARLPDHYFRIAADTTVTEWWGGAMEDLYEQPESFVGRRLTEVLPEAIHDALRKGLETALGGSETVVLEYALEVPSGSKAFEARLRGDGGGQAIAVIRDITERKRAQAERNELEERLRRSHKLEAVGTLAGGVAHDFNNILGTILGNAEMALADMGQEDPAKESLVAIRRATDRARSLVQQLILFSRLQQPERQRVRVGPLLERVEASLRAGMPAGVRLVVGCDPECPAVLGDADQLEQVLVNIGTNACQALAGGEGRVEMRAGVWEATVGAGGIPGGRFARISVTDDGQGMDEETVGRVFDPFFTTRGPGEGSGLGLAVAHGIVRNHGGHLSVVSKPGQGTTFRLDLPAAETARRSEG